MASSDLPGGGSQPEEEWIPLRRCAARCNRSLRALQKAIIQGRVPGAAVKRDRGRIVAVEFHAVSHAWQASTDPVAAARTTAPMPTTSTTQGGVSDIGHPPVPSSTPPSDGTEKAGDRFGYYESRARREAWDVQLRELEYLERAGALVVAEEAAKVGRDAYRMTRNECLDLPARVAPILVGKSQHQITALLDTEIRRTLSRLAQRFQQMADAEPSETE